MQSGERKIADTRGRFLQAIKGGRELNDAAWTSGRILLSNQQLVLAANGGNRTIPLSKISTLGGRFDVNQNVTSVANYVAVHLPNAVVLVAPRDHEEFEHALYGALIGDLTFLVRHPAVEGGVVRDSDWENSRVKVEEGVVNLATVGGQFVQIDLDDIGEVKTAERTIIDDTRTVLEVEHSDEGTSVQTYISGPEQGCSVLESLLRKGEERTETSLELSETDKQVLTALYSGVSPFDIPSFLGLDVDEVEALFQRLIDHNVVDEVRVRREVVLNARGRAIATDAIEDQ